MRITMTVIEGPHQGSAFVFLEHDAFLVGRSPEAGPAFPGYRIDRTLGEGGMGVVYLARREADNVPVALKVIKPAVAASESVLGRFLREASILRKLEHPNIVRFLDIGFAGGQL